MFLAVGEKFLHNLFLQIILQVIFHPQINCQPYESVAESTPVFEILKVPSDLFRNQEVAYRYSLKHGQPAPNKKIHILPERVRDDDIQLEYTYKCPNGTKTGSDRHLAQLVAVIYRKLDTSDQERTVTFYLPGPATVPTFRSTEPECPSEKPVPTTYVYKGCGGE